MRSAAYGLALESALRGVGLPYGYTATVWGSGAALTSSLGLPNFAKALLFAGGAVSGYGLLRFATRHAPAGEAAQFARSPHVVRAGVFHAAAIALGIGAAALAGLLDSAVAWALGTFGATLVYLGVVSIEMALTESEER